jgi:hypothetical protein
LRDVKQSRRVALQYIGGNGGDASYERLWDTEDTHVFDSHVRFMGASFGLCDTPD